jgi:hypothetical protein
LIVGLTLSSVVAAAPLGGPSGCSSLASIAPFTEFNYEMQLQGLWGLLLDPKDPDSGLCTSCHPGQSGAAALGLGDGFSYANLVDVASAQDPNFIRVIPGDPANSLLLQKVNCSTPGVGNRMPPTLTLSLTQQAFIADWIRLGAPLSRLGFEDR